MCTIQSKTSSESLNEFFNLVTFLYLINHSDKASKLSLFKQCMFTVEPQSNPISMSVLLGFEAKNAPESCDETLSVLIASLTRENIGMSLTLEMTGSILPLIELRHEQLIDLLASKIGAQSSSINNLTTLVLFYYKIGSPKFIGYADRYIERQFKSEVQHS